MKRLNMTERLDLPDEPNWRFGKEDWERPNTIWRCWHKCKNKNKWTYVHTDNFDDGIAYHYCASCKLALPSKVNVIAKLLGVNKPK